jgi:outer membrane protein assembly factor BamB
MGEAPPERGARPSAAPNIGSAAADEASAPAEAVAPVEPELGESLVPEIEHDAPPTVADIAVAPVEGDWAMFRGNGSRSGVRDAPAITSPRILWSARVGIQGYAATPVLTADAIYVASQGEAHDSGVSADERDGVMRLDPSNGAVVWRVAMQRDVNSVALYEDTLVVGTDSGALYALDPATGDVRWQQNTECNVYQSPAYANGHLYFPRRRGLGRLNLQTGVPAGGSLGECTNNERGVGSVASDGTVFMASEKRLLETFTGADIQWNVRPVPDQIGSIGTWSPPLLTESLALVTVHEWSFGPYVDRASLRPAVFAFWRDNGQLAWTIDVNSRARATPSTSTQTPFLRAMPWVDGERVWFTPTNRGEIAWFDPTNGQYGGAIELPDCRSRQFSSIVGVPGTGYLARHDGVLYAFNTTGEPALQWSLSLGQHGDTGGRTTHDPIGAGCEATPRDSTALFSTPSIGADGTLYVGSGDGYIYAIGQNTDAGNQ